jgi:inorganic pyrophosphatase
MRVDKLSTGRNPPQDVNVVIEIPQGSSVKYEIDKDTGAIIVDRFLFTPMAYPAAYGFIPGTLSDDGDPADALVLTPAVNLVPGSVIRARPIGLLNMIDEAGTDEKIICVPHDRIHPQFSEIHAMQDLPPITRQTIEHFFSNYKALEPGKWVRVSGWGDRNAAEEVIRRAIASAR